VNHTTAIVWFTEKHLGANSDLPFVSLCGSSCILAVCATADQDHVCGVYIVISVHMKFTRQTARY